MMTTDRHDELLESFSAPEVETTESLLRCMDGPATAGTFRRLLLLFLRGHYASAENFGPLGFDHLSCYVWDGNGGDLAVDFAYSLDDTTPDAYPGVFVTLGKVPIEDLSLGNHAGVSQDRSTRLMAREATLPFSVVHVARSLNDAFDLAEMSALATMAMAAPFAVNAGALGFDVVGMSQVQKKKPDPTPHYAVATEVRITYTMTAARSLESHRIRRIAAVVQPS